MTRRTRDVIRQVTIPESSVEIQRGISDLCTGYQFELRDVLKTVTHGRDSPAKSLAFCIRKASSPDYVAVFLVPLALYLSSLSLRTNFELDLDLLCESFDSNAPRLFLWK